MAEKKKIKGIKNDGGAGDGAQITVGDANPPKPGVTASADQIFQQAGYKSLCFNLDDIINTESILVDGVPTIVQARRIQRGTVLTTANNNSGTISENKSAKAINFVQPYLKEMGIVPTSEVKYDLVLDLSTNTELAVNVEILA